ncbi:MAG: hypothetical protein ACREDT_05650 [Methylocella sp.]
MKGMRFQLIVEPGRAVRHAPRLIARLPAGFLDLICDALLRPAPSGCAPRQRALVGL